MAKSVLKKKTTNRRLKRSVRRTLGALCMITAIIVAAIPFPDAAAESSGNAVATSDADYIYDVQKGYSDEGGDYISITDPSGKFDLTEEYKTTAGSSNIHMAHVIENVGGIWELDWQYKYYTKADGDVCLITEYNALYPKDTITLNSQVFSNYVNIPQEEYQKVLSGTGESVSVQLYAGDTPMGDPVDVKPLGKTYTLEGDPDKTSDEGGCKNTDAYDFFYTYFPEDLEDYQTAYRTYLQAIANNETAYEPNKVVRTEGDRYNDKAQYVCDQVFGIGTTAMSLEIVYKKVYNADGTVKGQSEEIRVPRLKTAPADGKTYVETGDGQAYRVDSNLFLAKNYASLVGVASGAFTDIQNVRNLTMSDQVYLIADSAFEHSFVQSITLARDSKIGNRAFYNCPSLTSVSMPENGITQIGTEAFAKTLISSIDIPATVETIGAGAFSDCRSLQTVTFSGTSSSSNREIQKFAFFNCPSLNTVSFQESGVGKIGEYAFAINEEPSGLTSIDLPNSISSADGIGDYLFGGRTNLVDVLMPKNLNTGTLPAHMFDGCVSLGSVTFPETAQGVSYESTMFSEVINENFHVRGPKLTYSGAASNPRQSTWPATFMNSADSDEQKYVPYVYNENGQDFYELNIGSYICVVDGNGLLISCTPRSSSTSTDFTIPSAVGDRTVTGIKDGAFGTIKDTTSVVSTITSLTVEDGCEIKDIGDNVFSGAPNLASINLGDSVQSIGSGAFSNCTSLTSADIGSGIISIGEGAFEGCTSLTEIAFDNPAGGASSFPLENIGKNAFSTKSPELTIYGLINGSYGPFAWAMQPDNYMNQSNGLRVCYKSAKDDPQGMTIILDNSNNLPTLIDYPKYVDIKDLDGDTPEEAAKIDAAINIVVPDGVRSIDTVGYFNSSSKDVNGYAPVYKSNETNISTYFSGDNIDLENENGLFLGARKNTPSGTVPEKIEDLYAVDEKSNLKNDTDDLTNYEKIEAGNDHIESIVLTSVEYLPENAFFSCERLETVDLGSAMKEMDALPFLGCNNLTSMACTSGNFSCNNGILYKNLEDGTKEIVECLPGRGDVVGSTTVSVANDPDLANVSSIAEEAFSYCPNINKVILDGASNLKEIPEGCFLGSEGLNEVDLPANVKMLDENAFSTGGDYLEVIVRGREVALIDPTFQGVKSPYLITYEDAAIRESAGKQGVNVETTLDEMLEVKFYMPDGATLIDTQFIEMNGNAKKLAPDADELLEQGYITADQDLYGWSGQQDITKITESCFFIAKIGLKTGIDTDGDGIPDTPNTDTDGDGIPDASDPDADGDGVNDNQQTGNTDTDNKKDDDDDDSPKYTLTVVYGDGSGVYKAGTKVIISAIEPPSGKEFYKWETNNSGVTITSATSAATTVKTTSSDATVTATYRNKSTVSGNSSVNRKPIGSSGTTVQITKSGISSTDKAYASVSGSTDNFIVKITESSAAANAVATALSNKYSDMNPIKYFAMDISLYDKNGNKVTNTNGLSVNITMPIPDALVQYGGNNKVGAVVNGNVLEDLSCKFTTVDGVPCITFTATHFSPYTVYVDTSNLSVNTLDSTPKTGDGIHPKWFVSIALACISLILFMKKDKVAIPKKVTV